jgi:HPt (histidine-containing phosphotransfer) domain-containing protein
MSDVLAELKARFLNRCVGDLERIEHLLGRGVLNADELQGLAHRLAGAAGTFGFPEISAAAGDCDDAFAQGGAPDRVAVARLVATMKDALARRTG